MRTLLRPLLFSLFVLPSAALAAPPSPAPASKPVAPPVPATLDVVTFTVHSEDQNHKLIVTTSPTMLRVDRPDEEYSIIYTAATESYLGLEHSNYTYWTFSWPEIKAAVETSKRYETHMQELTLAGIDPSAPTDKVPGQAAGASVPDTSGYTWNATNDHKKIAGLDCVRWTGTTAAGDTVEAWCYNGQLPKVQEAIDRIRVVNEPVALAAIRTIVPPYVFPIYDALARGGSTPIAMTWGGQGDKDSFALVSVKTRAFQPDPFTIPKLYMKTTLISMDGLIDQKK